MNDILRNLDEFDYKLNDFAVINILLNLMEREYLEHINISENNLEEFKILFFKLNDDLHKLYYDFLALNEDLENNYQKLVENLKKCYS